ncbi:MAG: hypothetical protein OXI20_08640 [Rhodospirillales bacterium]|nr:hypothetical protein [Rhodospirillales bacterium]
MPYEVLGHVDELCERGEFDEAINLLEEQRPEVMTYDIRALSRLAVSRYGAGDITGALKALDAADGAIDHAKALIELNRSNILKVMGEFDAALKAAHRVRALAPQWCAGHLMVIAVHECRDLPEDRKAVKDAVDTMKKTWPGWRQDLEFWRYLLTDADYSALRDSRHDFDTLFGDIPENVILDSNTEDRK